MRDTPMPSRVSSRAACSTAVQRAGACRNIWRPIRVGIMHRLHAKAGAMLTAEITLVLAGLGFLVLAHISSFLVSMPPRPQLDAQQRINNRRMTIFMFVTMAAGGLAEIFAVLLVTSLVGGLAAYAVTVVLVAALAFAIYRYSCLFEEARLCGTARPRLRRDNA